MIWITELPSLSREITMNDANKLKAFLAEIPLRKIGVAPVRQPAREKQNPRIDLTPEEWEAMDAHFSAEEKAKVDATVKDAS